MAHLHVTHLVYWGYVGIVEKKMETLIVHWGCIRIMEKKMETTIMVVTIIVILHNLSRGRDPSLRHDSRW